MNRRFIEEEPLSPVGHWLGGLFTVENLRYLSAGVLLSCLLTPVLAADRPTPATTAQAKPLAVTGVLAYDWSPDGQSLVYVTREGVWQVHGLNFDRPEQLIRKGKCMGGANEAPEIRWLPDGQKFVFLDSRPVDGWSSSWVAQADGSHVTELLPGWDFSYNSMRPLTLTEWVNNEALSVFFSCGPGCSPLGLVSTRAGQRPLLLGENFIGAPANVLSPQYSWSPSRRLVVSELNNGELGLLDVDAAQAGHPAREAEDYRFLLPACGMPPSNTPPIGGYEIIHHFNSWSPDETQGLVTMWRCGEAPIQQSPSQLSVWNIRQKRTQPLVANAGWGAWSPDGQKVAFVVFGVPQFDRQHCIVGTDFQVGQPFQLSAAVMDMATRRVSAVIPLGTSSMKELYPSALDQLLPVWSPTGTHLLLTDARKQKRIVRADGSERQRLTPSGEGTTTRWSPEGRWVMIHVLPQGPPPDCSQNPVETLLPPIGKEDLAVADAEMIKRYFVQRLLTEPELPESLPRYVLFLETLAPPGSSTENPEQHDFCQGLSQVLESPTWRTRAIPATIADKYEHRCSKQHARESSPAPSSPETAEGPAAVPGRIVPGPKRPGVFLAPGTHEATRKKEAASQATRQEQKPVELPSLYLVEVGSDSKAASPSKEN